jgi:hypothetical protein
LVDEVVITFGEVTETVTTAEHIKRVVAAFEMMNASIDSYQETHARVRWMSEKTKGGS